VAPLDGGYILFEGPRSLVWRSISARARIARSIPVSQCVSQPHRFENVRIAVQAANRQWMIFARRL